MAENKIRYGIQNVHVAFLKEDGTYEAPVAIDGARSLTTDPQGESTNWYADNVPYVTFNSNAGYTGSIEVAYVPDEILAKMMGWSIDAKGALVEDAEAFAKSFALLYEVKGDAKNRRNVFFNVSAARPSSSNSTQEASIDPQTETLNITMIPKKFSGSVVGTTDDKSITKLAMEPSASNKTEYDAFFTQVYIPQLDTGETGETGETGATGA